MVNIKNCFQERLRELRKGKGFTMEKMADELGISSGSISNYENGQRLPDIEIAAKIADYFGVSIDYLIGRTDTKTVNEDMQRVCKVTGLSEMSVKSLKEIKKGLLLSDERILNVFETIINSLSFKGLLMQCLELKDKTEFLENGITMQLIFHASYSLGINNSVLIEYITDKFGEETENHSDKGDLARYNSTKYLEKILDIFDFRSRTDFGKLSKEEWISSLKIDDSKLKELQERSEEYEACFEKAGD